jgi:hypothetical protein
VSHGQAPQIVDIRMYQVGFGDCFLLCLSTEPTTGGTCVPAVIRHRLTAASHARRPRAQLFFGAASLRSSSPFASISLQAAFEFFHSDLLSQSEMDGADAC